MHLCRVSLKYLIADLLLSCAEQGCKVDCGDNYHEEKIAEAIRQGLCIKATDAETADYTWIEVLQNKWRDITPF